MRFVDTRVSYRQTAFSYTIKRNTVLSKCQRPSASVYLLSLGFNNILFSCPRESLRLPAQILPNATK